MTDYRQRMGIMNDQCPTCSSEDIVGIGSTHPVKEDVWVYLCRSCGPSEHYDSEKTAANALFEHYDLYHKADDDAAYEHQKTHKNT